MSKQNFSDQEILAKLHNLPAEKVAEVVDFIDFLTYRYEADRQLSKAATKLSEEAFRKVWDNPEDSVYDNL